MKILGWYTVIFNLALILMLFLTSAGIIKQPPFTWFETLVWGVFTLPVIILGWVIARSAK